MTALDRGDLALDDKLSAITTAALANINNANISVAGGADLTLPALTTLTEPYGGTLQASGAGSVLDLTHLTSFSGAGAGNTFSVLNVTAQAGGKVDLSKVTSYTSGSTHFTADGAGSVIPLPGLQRIFSDVGNNSVLAATNGGTIPLNSGTVNLSRVDVQATGAGTVVGGTFQMSGGTLSGNGTIQANVFNSGTTAPGVGNTPGILSITGSFTQTSAGVLNIQIGGTTAGTQYDQLAVTGPAVIGGAQPDPDQRFHTDQRRPVRDPDRGLPVRAVQLHHRPERGQRSIL